MEQETTEARLSATERRKSAVIIREVDGKKVYKFPIPDKAHARQALRMINQSDLTDDEKTKVRNKAKEILGQKEFARWSMESENEQEDIIAPQELFLNEDEDENSSEARGGIGSVGGHDPRADKRPLRNLVDSFGKWAKGKQSTCVRVLTTRHPELCAGRPGGCNALCAYMKDQFLGTTKWRKGNKKNLVKRAVEGYVMVDGEEFILPEDMMIDALAIEADREINGQLEAPEWLTEEIIESLVELMNKDLEEVEEAELSYNVLMDKLQQLIQVDVNNRVKDSTNDFPAKPYDDEGYSLYPTIGEVFPGYVIYDIRYSVDKVRETSLYKQMYSVDSETVNLVGDPSLVVQTYVSAESDVDEPVSKPLSEAELSLSKIESELGEKIREQHKDMSKSESMLSYDSPYVKEVFKNYVIFQFGGQLFKQSYSVENDMVVLEDDTVEVEQVYKTKESQTDNSEPNIEEDSSSMFVVIEQDGDKFAVEMDKDSGEILKGPKDFVGKFLPPMPENVEATESSVLVDEETEVSVFELTSQESETQVAESHSDPLLTPSGLNVDAIVKIIRPGPGNMRDRFYYTQEAIESSIDVFSGKKMYKNHLTKSQEQANGGQPRSVDDWVATMKEIWVDESGNALGGITFVDDDFFAKAKKGKDDLGVSVRGRVRARPGSVNGESYNVVESFTYGGSVDFVTEAGAGGGFVSIAESEILENNMDPENMTLDQLLDANPQAFTEYADRLATESEANKDDEVDGDEVATESGHSHISLEDVKALITEAVEGAMEKVKQNELANNKMILNKMLSESDLPKATQARLARELHDVSFDAVEATEDTPAKTGLELFTEAVNAAMDEARAELREATEAFTTVDDGGVGEIVVAESGGQRLTGYSTRNNGVNKSIGNILGIDLVPSKVTEKTEEV